MPYAKNALIYRISYYELPDLLYALGGKATLSQIREYFLQKIGAFPILDKIVIFSNRFVTPYFVFVKYNDKEEFVYPDILVELKKERYERILKEKNLERLAERLPERDIIHSIHGIYAKERKGEYIIFPNDKHIIKAYIYWKFPLKRKGLRTKRMRFEDFLLIQSPIEIIE